MKNLFKRQIKPSKKFNPKRHKDRRVSQRRTGKEEKWRIWVPTFIPSVKKEPDALQDPVHTREADFFYSHGNPGKKEAKFGEENRVADRRKKKQ